MIFAFCASTMDENIGIVDDDVLNMIVPIDISYVISYAVKLHRKHNFGHDILLSCDTPQQKQLGKFFADLTNSWRCENCWPIRLREVYDLLDPILVSLESIVEKTHDDTFSSELLYSMCRVLQEIDNILFLADRNERVHEMKSQCASQLQILESMREFVESAPRGFDFTISGSRDTAIGLIRLEICNRRNLRPFSIAIQEIQQASEKSSDWPFPEDEESVIACLRILKDVFIKYDNSKQNGSTDHWANLVRCWLMNSSRHVIGCIESIMHKHTKGSRVYDNFVDEINKFGLTIDDFFEEERDRVDVFECLLAKGDHQQLQISRLHKRIKKLKR